MADHITIKVGGVHFFRATSKEMGKRPTMIAVMGLPYTFREEMGDYIAKWAKCSNAKLEVILNALLDANDPGAAALHSPSDVAFHILYRTALPNGPPNANCAVINFPTPANPQLQRLLTSAQTHRSRLLIIECERRNQFRWRRDVEHPHRNIWNNPRYATGNFKPGKWEDVEKAILNYQQQCLDASFLSLLPESPHHFYVKKLVVDPFEDLRSRDFTKDQGLDRSSLFAEAIKSYLSCDDDEYKALPVNIDYSVWRRQWLEHRASSRGEHKWCGAGDCILRFTNTLEELAEAICSTCDEKLTSSTSTSTSKGEGEGAFYCQFCSLCLHPFCALAVSPTALTAQNTYPHSKVVFEYGVSLKTGGPFKKYTACYSCKKDGKPINWECDGCVFQTHLKCQLLPTAVKHRCDPLHLLSISLSCAGIGNTVYECKACGLRGSWSSYRCNICNSEYHLSCVLDMPLETNRIAHGGHTHTLNIKFSCGQRELDEYEWCPVCYNDINPDTWVYTCLHCDFVAHLYCIFHFTLFEWYKDLTY